MSTDTNRTTAFLEPVPVPQPVRRRPHRAGMHTFVRGLSGFVTDWRACIKGAIPIGPTHPERAYITAKHSLNLWLNDTGADWHGACWHLGRDLPPAARNPGTTPTLGRDGLLDVRQALRALRHPAGFRPVPVWGAAYWRAIVDWAALTVAKVATRGEAITEWQGDSPRYADLWFVRADDHERILDACRELATSQTACRHSWKLWLEMIEYERAVCNGEPPC